MQGTAPTGRGTRIATAAALLGAVAFLVLSLSAAWGNTADDAYITLRYSRHLASGEGVSWNVDEPPVEGYSNFLFVLIGAVLIKLGAGDPMLWLKSLGALAAFGTLFVTFAIAHRHRGALAGAAAVVTALAHPGMAFWAVSGMETTVCQFLIVLSVYSLLRSPNETAEPHAASAGPPSRPLDFPLVVASLALFAASITRPESPILLAAFLPFILTMPGLTGVSSRTRAAATVLLPFLALYLPYTAWRITYFGQWLPNSAACKAGFSSDPFYLGREFLGFVGPLLILAVAGFLLGQRRRRRACLLLLGAAFLYFVTFYGVDPVMSHLDRHFLAVLPLVIIAAASGLFGVIEQLLPSRRRNLAGVVVLAAAIVFGVASAPGTLAKVNQAVELAHPLEDLRRELGTHLQTSLQPGDAFAIGDTGLVPFLAGGTVLDLYCLNCREATRFPIDRSPERLAEWVLSRRPRFIVIQAVSAASKRGVWPADRALGSHPTLRETYTLRREFGGTGDPLHYLLYERRVAASL